MTIGITAVFWGKDFSAKGHRHIRTTPKIGF